MATWGELQHIFELPLGEKNPKFHEPISSPWKHIEPMKSVDDHFTKIFAQLYLKENLDQDQSSSPSPSLFTLSPSSSLSSDFSPKNIGAASSDEEKKLHRRSDSASSFSSERSSICNDDDDDIINVEDSIKDESNDSSCQHQEENHNHHDHARTSEYCCLKKSSSCKRRSNNNNNNNNNNNYGGFPPPISCIGRSGKPWVSFQTIRKNGRFILTEVRIPTQEFMHACRENGRLKLHFIHSESEEEEEEEEEEMGENDDDGGDSEAMEA